MNIQEGDSSIDACTDMCKTDHGIDEILVHHSGFAPMVMSWEHGIAVRYSIAVREFLMNLVIDGFDRVCVSRCHYLYMCIAQTRTHLHAQTRTRPRAHSALTHPPTRTDAQTHIGTHAHTHTRTCGQTHTHIPSRLDENARIRQ